MRSSMLLTVGLLVHAAAGCGITQEVAGPPSGDHALLVGCTKYPSLDKAQHLEGPGNDVALMRTLLTGRFGFPAASITVLTEDAGGERNRPTRANIEREFRALEEAARAGDRVVILLSGHGSYQPDQAPIDEPDGMDELFLPADITGWDRDGKQITNAIVDDELRLWLEAIQAKGASVWLVMDSCHSGTMMRGNGVERSRRIRPEDLGVPKEALAQVSPAAERGAERARGEEPTARALDLPTTGAGIVAIYAARPEETAPEMPLPDNAPEAKYHGLLTYTISKVLAEAQGPISYRQLVRRIHDQYAALGRLAPTPMIEGTDQDRVILGRESLSPVQIRLARDGDDWMIDAGALHGLTAGSILAVAAPRDGGKPDAVVGHVRIAPDGIEPIRALVEPCAYPDPAGPVLVNFPKVGLCRPVFIDYGVFRVRLGVDDKDSKGHLLSEADRHRLIQARDALAGAIQDEGRERKANARPGPGRGAMIDLVAAPDQADWLIRVATPDRAASIYLVPGAGVDLKSDEGEPPPLFGPVPPGEKAGPWLLDRLARIAGCRNLLRIAGDRPGSILGGDPDLGLKVEMRKLRGRTDREGQAILPATGVNTLREGDLIGIRLNNTGRESLDVTVLLIDSGFGITPLFPGASGTDNRLKPGNASMPIFRVTVETTGLEHLLITAVKSRNQGLPADFSWLGQPTIEKARGLGRIRGEEDPTFGSPLGQLLQAARYEGTRGGAAVTTIDDHRLQLLSWHTIGREPPPPGKK